MTPVSPPLEERRLLGIGLVLMAYFLFTCMDGSAKWLGLVGVPALQIMLVRYLVHLCIVSAIYLPKRGRQLLASKSYPLELLRAGALLGSTLCNFTAVRYLPLTVTGAISFTTPMIICILSVFFLKEQVGWRRWTAIAIGFVGVLVIVRPGSETFHPATLLSISGATFYGFYALLTRRLAGIDSAATQQFYGGFFATIAIAPFALANWVWPTRPLDWAVMLTLGLMGYLAHQFITVASRFAPASTLAPFAYVQIVFIAFASWLVFGQPPELFFYLGAPIVIGSGFYLWLRERALARPLTPVAEQL